MINNIATIIEPKQKPFLMAFSFSLFFQPFLFGFLMKAKTVGQASFGSQCMCVCSCVRVWRM